jgi:hypothetical protein
MSQSKRVFTLTVAIAVLTGYFITFITGVFLFSQSSRASMGAKNDLLYKVCEIEDFSEEDYNRWFTESFREYHTYEGAKEAIDLAFPEDYDCLNLRGSILKILGSSQDLTVQGDYVAFEYRVSEDMRIETILVQSDEDYKLDQLVLID